MFKANIISLLRDHKTRFRRESNVIERIRYRVFTAQRGHSRRYFSIARDRDVEMEILIERSQYGLTVVNSNC